MIEIEIPCASCIVHPLMATPYTTDVRMRLLSKLHKEGGALPSPVVRNEGDRFVVVFGWDVISLLQSCGVPRVRVHMLREGDEPDLKWCITKHAQEVGLSWIDIAQAYAKAKAGLNSTDQEIAEKVGVDRSKVAKMVKIASRLNPKLIKLAQQSVLNYSDCRRLVTLSSTEQELVAAELHNKHWLAKQILARVFPEKSIPTQVSSFEKPPKPIKTTDLKRLEISISERIGYPFEIQLLNERGNAGSLEYQFFDRAGMIDVLSKLRGGFLPDAKVSGKIVLTFDSLDQFESLTGNFSAE
jgi:ParB family chromosome partitioning protein